MPALKFVQVALVTSSLLTVGGVATYDVWGSKAPVALELSEADIQSETGGVDTLSNARVGAVIPELSLSTHSIGSQFAYRTSLGAGSEVDKTAAMLDELAYLKKKKQKKMRFGAFEGY